MQYLMGTLFTMMTVSLSIGSIATIVIMIYTIKDALVAVLKTK